MLGLVAPSLGQLHSQCSSVCDYSFQLLLRTIECQSPATHHLRTQLNGHQGPTAFLGVQGPNGIPSKELAHAEAKTVATTINEFPTHTRGPSSAEHPPSHHKLIGGQRRFIAILSCPKIAKRSRTSSGSVRQSPRPLHRPTRSPCRTSAV